VETLKSYMENEKENTDANVFKNLELSEKDMKVLKVTILSEDVSIPSLINLVLRERAGNVIKEENKEELEMRGYITEKGNITDIGKTFVGSDEVKERLSKLLDE
jgi:hypothetical protein